MIPFSCWVSGRSHSRPERSSGRRIALTVTFQDTTLYIFKDSADFVTPVYRRQFEKRDFQNLEALRAACIEFLAALPR